MTPNKDFADSKEEQDSLNRERSRRSVFTFSMVDIPVGSELAFLKDENKTAKVTADREIEYLGTKSSLNKITLEILEKDFGKNWGSCRGPDYWIFENETLTERRIRMEDSSD